MKRKGRKIGEAHHRARLPDWVVVGVRDLHEHQGMTYRQIIDYFREFHRITLTYSWVSKVGNYERRTNIQ